GGERNGGHQLVHGTAMKTGPPTRRRLTRRYVNTPALESGVDLLRRLGPGEARSIALPHAVERVATGKAHVATEASRAAPHDEEGIRNARRAPFDDVGLILPRTGSP